MKCSTCGVADAETGRCCCPTCEAKGNSQGTGTPQSKTKMGNVKTRLLPPTLRNLYLPLCVALAIVAFLNVMILFQKRHRMGRDTSFDPVATAPLASRSGVSGVATAPPTAIQAPRQSNEPQATMRLLKRGDSCNYRVTGLLRLTNGATYEIQNGEILVTVTEVQNPDWLAVCSDFMLPLNGGRPIRYRAIDYISQNSETGMRFKIGDNGGEGGTVRMLPTPQPMLPARMLVGESLTVDFNYSKGEQIHEWKTVLNYDLVQTEVGAFPCSVVGQRDTGSFGSLGVGTIYYSCSLGTDVKSEITVTRPDGSILSLKTLLQSTNISR